MPPRRGFTFVELLVAMLFLGALTATAVPRYRAFKERATLTLLRTDLGHMRIAQEAFWAENRRYTTDLADLDWRATSQVTITITADSPELAFTAVATHANVPGQQCGVTVGAVTGGAPSGEIVCGSAAAGPGTGVTKS